MNNCFKQLIDEFRIHFRAEYDIAYTNQTVESCQVLYNIVVQEKPNNIIEIGTNYGASTVSMALALKELNIPLSTMTTIDVSHDHWKKRTPIVLQKLIAEQELDITEIKTITGDFVSINPKEIINVNVKTLIFYDIHDHKGPWSLRLMNLWYPLIKNGVFIVHDITPVDADFVLKNNLECQQSKATYFNGQTYAGFLECARLITWANENKIILTNISGGVLFYRLNI